MIPITEQSGIFNGQCVFKFQLRLRKAIYILILRDFFLPPHFAFSASKRCLNSQFPGFSVTEFFWAIDLLILLIFFYRNQGPNTYYFYLDKIFEYLLSFEWPATYIFSPISSYIYLIIEFVLFFVWWEIEETTGKKIRLYATQMRIVCFVLVPNRG